MKKNLSNQIIHAYEKNVFYMSLLGAGHFFTRAFKATGDKKYKNIIAWHLKVNRVEPIKRALKKLKSNDFTLEKKFWHKNNLDKRKQLRSELYKINPEIDLFNNLLIDMFFCKMHYLDRTVLKNEFRELLNYLKKINFKKIYLREEVVKKDSSYPFNSAFILKDLGICDFTKEMEGMLKSLYIGHDGRLIKKLPNYEFKSLIYSMTHIIIADSKFYERFVSGHEWIISFFIKNLDYIIEKSSLDILAEVALCIKLCKKNDQYINEYKRLLNHLEKSCRREKLNDPHFIVKKEHTNSILMLLFSENLIFHKGPDLSKHKIFL